mmetsp:Transcript_5910/g.11535  ORF Transcript_5910/g.11535 Transcript_5910/m.11535 type:complete len:821 (+) Transcript_5910:242-2704(+)
MHRDFSEDEEEAFVAEFDSSTTENTGESDLNTANVTSSNTRTEKVVPCFSPGGDPYKKRNGRHLILFDLNGVLVHHHFDGSQHVHTLRPGVANLIKLKEHYDLGIYSSATERTVKFAIKKIDACLARSQENNHLEGSLFSVFDVVLHRKHCVLASEAGLSRKDGKPWDTVKPLERYFSDFDSHVVLIDDSSHKSWPGEENYMVVLPTWSQEEEAEAVVSGDRENKDTCHVLRDLTNILLSIEDETKELKDLITLAQERFKTEEDQVNDKTEQCEEVIDLVSESGSVEILEVLDDRGGALGKPKPAEEYEKQYTKLHYELEVFVEQATPSAAELNALNKLINKMDAAVKSLWPEGKAVIFGSQASGLALPGADLDVAIVGVGPNMSSASSGFSSSAKRRVKEMLHALVQELMRRNVVQGFAEIIEARIPIIKFSAHLGSSSVPVDISVGTQNGIAAVEFLRANILTCAPLRPLVLYIKSVLRERNLNEVFTGGMGSYSVVNIVMAYLQQQGHNVVQAYDIGSTKDPSIGIIDKIFEKVREKSRPRKGTREPHTLNNSVTIEFVKEVSQHNIEQLQARECDLGVLLWGLLDFYGNRFDYLSSAVSIMYGGMTRKGSFYQNGKPWLLAIEDPQDPGRDICGGTYLIHDIKKVFQGLAIDLAEVSDVDRVNDQRVDLEKPLTQGSLIASTLDLVAALDRGKAGVNARKRIASRKSIAVKKKSRSNATRIFKQQDGSQGRGSIGLGVSKKKIKKKKNPANGPRGKAGSRGSKMSRAIEAQWSGKNKKKGQHFHGGEQEEHFPRNRKNVQSRSPNNTKGKTAKMHK